MLKPCLQAPMSEPQTNAELIQQGLVHHRSGQLSLAMDRYTQVLRNDPQNADALYYIAVVACHEGQFQQGIDLARRSLSYRPRQARAHNLIGQALHRMGQIKDALESFDTAIECDVNFADAYGNRADRETLFALAREHHLEIISIEELIRHRRRSEKLVYRLNEPARLPTRSTRCTRPASSTTTACCCRVRKR